MILAEFRKFAKFLGDCLLNRFPVTATTGNKGSFRGLSLDIILDMSDQLFERKLAAIVAADVVGYSRLMGLDETRTLTRLNTLRRAFIEPAVAQYHGRIVKLMGDGILIEFPSVVDALSCSVQIQREVPTQNESLPEDQRIEFRIGINLGDIIVEGDDIHGDGVNIAARLEPLAEPGGICLSQVARDALGKKLPLEYENMGAQTLKNIAEPMHAYRVTVPVGAIMPKGRNVSYEAPMTERQRRLSVRLWRWATATVVLLLLGSTSALLWWQQTVDETVPRREINSLANKPSIAVMPFENLSNIPDRDYFSDGVTENLITDLSKISGLLVIARNSVFAYKGRSADARTVASELGVRYVLSGSIRQADEQLRINVQLTDASNNAELWAERYDRKLVNIFELQDEISRTIIQALSLKLTPGEQKQLDHKTTNSLEAYDYYQQGRSAIFSTDRARGRELLSKAIEIDPKFAEAFAALAYSYSLSVVYSDSDDETADLDRAFTAATQAVSLNSQSAEAHYVLALIFLMRGQHEQSQIAAERAIAANPNYPSAYGVYGWAKTISGDYAAAIEPLSMAIRVQPRSNAMLLGIQGYAYMLNDRFYEALEILEKSIQLNPVLVTTRVALIATYQQLGMKEEAAWETDELLISYPDFAITRYIWIRSFKNQNDVQVRQFKNNLQNAGLPLE